MVNQEYRKALDRDTLEQFRGKSNLEILHDALARQLQEVYECFAQLNDQRDLYTAVGAQLNGIGEIAALTRMEAGLLAGNPIPFDVIDDETYRQYLIWKVLKNTTDCTYHDIIKAFRMFWDKPLYYREDPEQPATMIFDTGAITADTDVSSLIRVPILRAAGVTVKIVVCIVSRTTAILHIGGGVGTQTSIGMPTEPDDFRFQNTMRIGGNGGIHSTAGLCEKPDIPEFSQTVHAGGYLSNYTSRPVPEDTSPPSATTILRTGGVCTIISNQSKGE